jgi:hypothetical protein
VAEAVVAEVAAVAVVGRNAAVLQHELKKRDRNSGSLQQ